MTGHKERVRLLRILCKEKAELEWPCRNQDLRLLVAEGLVARTRNYTASWGGKERSMTSLQITPIGRDWLTDNQ